MTATFRLGRVAGVPVGVHWSVLVIFALIAWGLAVVRLPTAYPGQPVWAYAAAGLAAAVVFFVGLLAHEVSHAVVARRNGVDVDDITLWLFGGVARLRSEASTPGADLRIAGVGPLVSLLLGLAFAAVAAALAAAGLTGLVSGAVGWLAAINILLAVFNVIPAAPLDGGRLLRAVLWAWSGDRERAALSATRAGRVLGLVLVALGLWGVLATGDVGSLWLALIGWFLMGAASAEEQQVRVQHALAALRVRDVMTPDPQTVPPVLTVADFVEDTLFRYRHSAYPIVREDAPLGLVTLRRVRAVPAGRRSTTTLGDVATTGEALVLTTPDESLAALTPRLQGSEDRRALVVESGHLVGIVSASDLGRALTYSDMRGSRPV